METSTTATATSTVPATTSTAANPENEQNTQTQIQADVKVKLMKPSRKDFYRSVVLNAKGEIISEDQWKPLVGESDSGRALSGKLRRNGLQIVHVFDKPQYDAAKQSYSAAAKQAKITERDMLIIGAFTKAEVPVEPHIERALKDLLPIFERVSLPKTSVVFKNVVRTIANGIGTKEKPTE